MATITFHHHDGRAPTTVEAPAGMSLMRAAISNGVDGILGECGGQCMCATCHVYVHDDCLGQLAAPDENETEMLDNVATERTHRSRLCCQVQLGNGLTTLAVDIPARQL